MEGGCGYAGQLLVGLRPRVKFMLWEQIEAIRVCDIDLSTLRCSIYELNDMGFAETFIIIVRDSYVLSNGLPYWFVNIKTSVFFFSIFSKTCDMMFYCILFNLSKKKHTFYKNFFILWIIFFL